MPERGETEVFSNPLPPTDFNLHEEDDEGHALTNEDFRKMLMTPRVPSSTPTAKPSTKVPAKVPTKDVPVKQEEEDDDPATRRKKKKIYYAKLKKLEEERQKELEAKYRDRAKERREGVNRDYEQTEIISTTADYRAVAPDIKAGENLAERRKQVIQESKYLGGDMEHTHLVKGLDFALLEKVRAEISSKEREEEITLEEVVDKKEEKEVDPEEQIQFKTKMGRNIYRTLFKQRQPERNELFLPRRMAYVVDIEDEFADSDVPTTTIRSKADCPTLEANVTLTTNDIVINKLTQILSYLRQGKRESKKLKKKEKGKLKEEDKMREKLPGADMDIYADLADYNPYSSKSKDKKDKKDRDRGDDHRDRGRDRDRGDRDRDYRDRDRDRRDHRDKDRDRGRDRDSHRERDRKDDRKRKSYFEKPAEETDTAMYGRDRGPGNARDLVRSINERFKNFAGYGDFEEEKKAAESKEKERLKKMKARMEIDSYAECYPGMEEAADAFGDSDEEADYSKMDQGNKKGPVGRWDFDTQEEYSDYMANKEALPKAAFQYGVKMADGRKTRRAGPKDEKAELDRQWQKIQNILNKRKTGEPDEKKMKM